MSTRKLLESSWRKSSPRPSSVVSQQLRERQRVTPGCDNRHGEAGVQGIPQVLAKVRASR